MDNQKPENKLDLNEVAKKVFNVINPLDRQLLFLEWSCKGFIKNNDAEESNSRNRPASNQPCFSSSTSETSGSQMNAVDANHRRASNDLEDGYLENVIMPNGIGSRDDENAGRSIFEDKNTEVIDSGVKHHEDFRNQEDQVVLYDQVPENQTDQPNDEQMMTSISNRDNSMSTLEQEEDKRPIVTGFYSLARGKNESLESASPELNHVDWDYVIPISDDDDDGKDDDIPDEIVKKPCFRCPNVNGTFKRKSRLHRQRHVNDDLFMCITCKRSHTKLNFAISHEIRVHGSSENIAGDGVVAFARNYVKKKKKQRKEKEARKRKGLPGIPGESDEDTDPEDPKFYFNNVANSNAGMPTDKGNSFVKPWKLIKLSKSQLARVNNEEFSFTSIHSEMQSTAPIPDTATTTAVDNTDLEGNGEVEMGTVKEGLATILLNEVEKEIKDTVDIETRNEDDEALKGNPIVVDGFPDNEIEITWESFGDIEIENTGQKQTTTVHAQTSNIKKPEKKPEDRSNMKLQAFIPEELEGDVNDDLMGPYMCSSSPEPEVTIVFEKGRQDGKQIETITLSPEKAEEPFKTLTKDVNPQIRKYSSFHEREKSPSILYANAPKNKRSTPDEAEESFKKRPREHVVQKTLLSLNSITFVKWGGVITLNGSTVRLSNTCNFDTTLMVLHALFRCSPIGNAFITSKLKSGSPIKMLLDELDRGRVNTAKQIFVSSLLKSTSLKVVNGQLDLLADERDSGFSSIGNWMNILRRQRCENHECVAFRSFEWNPSTWDFQREDMPFDINIRNTLKIHRTTSAQMLATLNSELSHEEWASMETKCMHCREMCYVSYAFPGGPPDLLFYALNTLGSSFDTDRTVPKLQIVQGFEYCVFAVSVFSADRKHYMSIIYQEGHAMLYDGLADDLESLTVPLDLPVTGVWLIKNRGIGN